MKLVLLSAVTLAGFGSLEGPCDSLRRAAAGETETAAAPPPAAATATATAASPPTATATAAAASFACEVTKRTHTCQAAEGSMLSCTATSRIPWEKKIVNGVFNLVNGTKAGVDACGKIVGGEAGTYVISGLVDDPQKGPRMNMKPRKGSGPTAECLAKALSITLPKAPRGEDDPPAPLTLNYALDVTVECK